MHRVPVTSTQLASIGWEALPGQLGIEAEKVVGTLEVEFTRGQVYRYAMVPQAVHQRLLTESALVQAAGEIPSVGRAFDRLVKQPGYTYERVEATRA